MSNLLFKRWNDFGGWLVFLIAAFVYGMTIEPTASFWDCPEFISCAEKLQVGHPPGAPFYMLVGQPVYPACFRCFASVGNGQLFKCTIECRLYLVSFLEYYSISESLACGR